MRLHLVSLPHTQTTRGFMSCAYTQKVVRFCKMMTSRGHEVILYAGEENEALCSEHVPLMSEEKRSEFFGPSFDTVLSEFKWDAKEPYWEQANVGAICQIGPRFQEGDLILLTTGWPQKPIEGVFGHSCEWTVGYEGIATDYCAFESHVWRHHVYGIRRWAWGRQGDDVIPSFFDPEDFIVNPAGKDDYALFVGRLVQRKGPDIAARIANQIGLPLVVAGPGAKKLYPGKIVGEGVEIEGDVSYVGEVGPEERAKLMSEARMLIAPTQYLEPFGNVAVEAMMCGTPVVTTNFGAFVETVEEGVAGYRFTTEAEGADAALSCLDLDPDTVRGYAEERYALEAVAPRFETWLGRVQEMNG